MRHLHPITIICCFFALISPEPVQAWTAQEIRAMPAYCAGRYARNDNPAEYKRWEAQYGPDFLHTHHLCDGIGLLNNYHKARTAQERKGILDQAMGTLNYMVQHAKPDFKLMPEVYWYRSRVFQLMDRAGEAVGDLRKAIDLDPKQARFYTQAAEQFEKLRQRGEALSLVSEGLRHLPGHKGLQTLYARLGGQLPYPEPYAGNEDKVTSGPGSAESSADADKQLPRTPRSAIFDLSRNTGSARKEAPILNAGAYLLVEVKEDLSVPELVHLRIQSQIPQPAARIPSVALDTGRFSGLIAALEVKDPLLGKYYPLRSTGGSHGHAYWPTDFTPDYVARFTIDPKAGKMYDPRSLAPGSALNLVARLAPGVSFDDVVEAMKLGLKSPDGVRIGVIAHHLMGYRPDPAKTIMDDAGFLSGTLRQLIGFQDEQKPSSAPAQAGEASAQSAAGPREAAVANDRTPAGQGQASTPDAAASDSKRGMGTPSNPWCRFCPEPSAK